MVAGLVGTGVALLGTGLTVLQTANSAFWVWLGVGLMVLGTVALLMAIAIHQRRRRGAAPSCPRSADSYSRGIAAELETGQATIDEALDTDRWWDVQAWGLQSDEWKPEAIH
jgi:hypothetical protein